ncbi:MAG: valine--tRNA ligase [Candidatus Njordarchaeia archaeon]
MEPKLKEKRWNPKKEAEIFETWEKEEIYKFNPDSGKPIFSIDTPPPYASGKWHIGGAIHYSQIDMIARYMRMKGYEVLFPMGIDRNGLPIEVQVEKKYNINMWKTPREKFIELCHDLLDTYENDILNVCRYMGFSMNSLKPEDVYRTDSPEYRKVTQATFIELYKRGLVYEDYRPNNWCPRCKTTLADAELEYQKKVTKLVYIKFKLKDENGYITIATTRPELLPSCKIIIVHPEDERYKKLHHKKVIVPIFGQEVEIIPHNEANPEFGTGAVMICSYGDQTDVRLFRELKLKPVISITTDGTMSDAAQKYKGLPIEEARERIIKDLMDMGLVEKIEEKEHSFPVCWRCKTPIEFIPMKEWYLKQVDYLDDLKKHLHEIKFHPDHHKHILINWINSVTIDWPISRRRYYGTEIPVWYCKCNHHVILPKEGEYHQPWKEKPPVDKCPICGCTEFEPEWRTFDTWFDSSISALFVSGYKRDEKLFKKAFPVSLRPQGKEIVRTWLYYTLLRTYQLTGKMAFKHVWISGLVMDEKGEAMHKSKGNVVYPKPIVDKYGADALRLAGATDTKLGSDIRYSDKRVESASRFIQKLWSIARFVSMFPDVEKPKQLLAPDKWILAELNKTIEEVTELYDDFDFFGAQYVINFVWDVFADHYIEMVKGRAFQGQGDKQKSAWWTLHKVLKTVLKMLAPVIPFVTDYIYRELYGKFIHLEPFPEAEPFDKSLLELTSIIRSVNSAIWKKKRESGLSLKSKIKALYLPTTLKPFESDLKMMHHTNAIYFGNTKGDKITTDTGLEIGIEL